MPALDLRDRQLALRHLRNMGADVVPGSDNDLARLNDGDLVAEGVHTVRTAGTRRR